MIGSSFHSLGVSISELSRVIFAGNRTSFVPVLYQFRTTMHKRISMSSENLCHDLKTNRRRLSRRRFPSRPVPDEPSIRYGKLLLVNRPLQNREKWPEFELFAHGETHPRRPGSCLRGTKRGAARFRLSVCLFGTARWLTAWLRVCDA